MKKINAMIAASLAAVLLAGGISVIATEKENITLCPHCNQPITTDAQKSQAKVNMQEKAKEKLAKQLEEGKITQEQYEETLAKIENGEFEFGKRMNGRNKESKKLTEEEKVQMKAKMQEKAKERLAGQLEEGKITQEQYEEMLAKIENGEFKFGFGRGNGRKGGFKKAERTRVEATEKQETATK